MAEQHFKWRFGALVAVMALASCGGGGGGGSGDKPAAPAAFVDGLGVAGQTSDTVVVGTARTPGGGMPMDSVLAVTMHDLGGALMVWRLIGADAASSQTMSASMTASGAWQAPVALSQAQSLVPWRGIFLRSNHNGDAVLGFTQQVVSSSGAGKRAALRFFAASGWESQTQAWETTDIADWFYLADVWDLSLLDNGTLASTVMLKNAANVSLQEPAVLSVAPDGTKKVDFRVTETATSALVNGFSLFTPQSNGTGLQYMMTSSKLASSEYTFEARIASVGGSALSSFPIADYRRLCTSLSPHHGSVNGTIQPPGNGVIALLASRDAQSSCSMPSLQAIRVSTTPSIQAIPTVLNTPGTTVGDGPYVLMDASNNALVVWKEVLADGVTRTPPFVPAYMWSKSMAGGAWSTPAALNLDALGRLNGASALSIRMNSAGQVVAGLRLANPDTSSANWIAAIGRFDFASGWKPWRAVASKLNMTEPQVAVDGKGKAVAAYTAVDGTRVPGQSTSTTSSSSKYQVYALPF